MSRDEFTLPIRQRTDIGDGSLDFGAGPLFVRLACWSGGWETRRVVAGPQSHQLRLAGRADELAELSGLIHAAAGGRAGAMLLSGEAGVGKTALARAACSGAESKVDVLWGSCLPLTSLAVPFLPLTTALRQWQPVTVSRFRCYGHPVRPGPVMDRLSSTLGWPASADGGRWSWSWTTCTGRIRARWTC